MADTQSGRGRSGSAALPPDPVVREPFRFTGRTDEYFRIWIVNLLLTIVTLGVYSAWATARRRRYFHRNTVLAGASFDYRGNPAQILFGRSAVLVLTLACYAAFALVHLYAGIAVAIAFFITAPWLTVRGLRFGARATSYRDVRFDFHGRYIGAFKSLVFGSLLTALTLGVLAPFASRRAWRYLIENTTYGGRGIASDPRLGALYGQWLLPASIVLCGLAMLGIAAVAVQWIALAGGIGRDGREFEFVLEALFALIVVGLGLTYAVAGLFYAAGVRNVVFDATVIDGRHRLVSKLDRRRFAFIAITNFLATILSLGLARPWANIRMARYVAGVTALDVNGSLELSSSSVRETGAAGRPGEERAAG